MRLPTRPETVVWGHLPSDRPAVLEVEPGTVVIIETLSHQGLLTDADPVEFLGRLGVGRGEVLDDAVDVHARVPRAPGDGVHVLTGPIHVRGAEPGDALEVQVVAASPRVPYGINRGAPGAGVLPGLLDLETYRLMRLDRHERAYPLGSRVQIPFRPFPGFVATAPALGVPVSTRAPGPWGGNIDCRQLGPGSCLVLPVQQVGAGLYVGDPHGAQGHGEVNGTAVEHSMTFVVRLGLRSSAGLRSPRIETLSSHIVLGIASDLTTALEEAVRAAVARVVDLAAGDVDVPTAYAICSTAVDFGIGEAVNGTVVVHAEIPDELFAGDRDSSMWRDCP